MTQKVNTAIVFPIKIPLSKKPYHTETGQSVCNSNQIDCFDMIQVCTERYFSIDLKRQNITFLKK